MGDSLTSLTLFVAESKPLNAKGERGEHHVVVNIQVVSVFLINVHLQMAHIILRLCDQDQRVCVLNHQVIKVVFVPFLSNHRG